jgi:tetratricopeptide (TPR) repeat protein
MQGNYHAALDAARRLQTAVDVAAMTKDLPQGELYIFTPIATQLRFGQWRAILAEPPPPGEFKLDLAVWLYARGFAHANTGDFEAAKADRARLAGLAGGDFARYDAFNVPARALIPLALALLDGEIARTAGHLDEAVADFTKASQMEHEVPYSEPPYWHQPVSHLLGAALLQAHRPAEAEAVYRESLKTYRADGWALFGLAQALDAQGKPAEAAETRQAFDKAWSFADVKLASSRF